MQWRWMVLCGAAVLAVTACSDESDGHHASPGTDDSGMPGGEDTGVSPPDTTRPTTGTDRDTTDTALWDSGDTIPSDTADTTPGDTTDTAATDTGDTTPHDTTDTVPPDTGDTTPQDTSQDTTPADECNSTAECRAIWGSQATDCVNSSSDQSWCACGSVPCRDMQDSESDTVDTTPQDTGDTTPQNTDTVPTDSADTTPPDTGWDSVGADALGRDEFSPGSGTAYYVAPAGDDANPGTKDQPFATVQKGLDSLRPGDTLFLRGGTYRQTARLSGLDASSARVLIRNYPGETARIDGTVTVASIAEGNWTPYRDGIYKVQLQQDVWQLFLDDQLVYLARWPNAALEDYSLFDREAATLPYSQNGTTITVSGLDAFPAAGRSDFSKAIAVTNGHHWTSDVHYVDWVNWSNGQVGLDSAPDNWNGTQQVAYFLGLACLDRDNEWWFDASTDTLYYRAPGGVDPATLGTRLTARVVDHALTIEKSRNVVVHGLSFFSAAVAVTSSATDIRINGCRFDYPSTHKIPLGVFDAPPHDGYQSPSGHNVGLTMVGDRGAFTGNVVLWSNMPLVLTGDEMEIANNVFGGIEWDVISNGGSGSITIGPASRFVRNQVAWGGNSEGVRPVDAADDAEIAYNRVSHMSMLQFDGSAINVSLFAERNHVHHNWVHDNKRLAIRWDWWPAGASTHGGVFHHNVTWNSEPWQIKNDHNLLYNNVGTQGAHVWLYQWDGGINDHTLQVNNLSTVIMEDGDEKRDNGDCGDYHHNYEGGGSEFALLTDASQFDFRPKATSTALIDRGTPIARSEIDGLSQYGLPVPLDGDHVDLPYLGSAPDIGAYEFGATHYWIPGPQYVGASFPIPQDGATGQSVDRDLIFLIGYGGVGADVYLGTDPQDLQPLAVDLDADSNVVHPDGLQPHTTYYWRVDTHTAGGAVVPGPTWSFSTQ